MSEFEAKGSDGQLSFIDELRRMYKEARSATGPLPKIGEEPFKPHMVMHHLSDIEAGQREVSDLVSDAAITVLYRQSQGDLPARDMLVIDTMAEYLPLKEVLMKMGDQVLRFEGEVNPVDPAIFANPERPQLAADTAEAISYAEDLEEEQ
jgi:hypothetical protein